MEYLCFISDEIFLGNAVGILEVGNERVGSNTDSLTYLSSAIIGSRSFLHVGGFSASIGTESAASLSARYMTPTGLLA